MAIYALGEIAPQIDPSAWVADSAQVMGRVIVEEDASVWFGAVLRGDNEPIHIGQGRAPGQRQGRGRAQRGVGLAARVHQRPAGLHVGQLVRRIGLGQGVEGKQAQLHP